IIYGLTISYSVTVNEQTLDNWKLLMTDDDGYAYMIYGDLMPNAAIPQAVMENEHINKSGTYIVYSTTSRADLIHSMSNSENWSSLITQNLRLSSEGVGKTVIATGGATVTQIKKSWNDQYPLEPITVNGNETDGWPNLQDLVDKEAYLQDEEDNMYFPRKTIFVDGSNECRGYWLASYYNQDSFHVMMIYNIGSLNDGSYNYAYGAFRPVIKIPSSILEMNEDGTSCDIKI
ncbi:MAG: hypothetical protein K6B70_08105, partial [Clostridia bacterium]|nr:hypothetical protein [Clostridia bacterium]